MLCAIWYQSYNLKSVKNIHRGVLILVKLEAKVTCYVHHHEEPHHECCVSLAPEIQLLI